MPFQCARSVITQNLDGAGGAEGREPCGCQSALSSEPIETAETRWGHDHRAYSPHPAPRFEERIEIQWEIFPGDVRDRADDGKGHALRLGHLSDRGTLHIERYGTGEAAEVLLFDRPAHHRRQRDHRTVSHYHSNLCRRSLHRVQHHLFADDRCSGLTPDLIESPQDDAGRHDHISDRRRGHECAGKPCGNRQRRAMPIQDRARRGVRRLRSDARGNKPISSTGLPADETAHTVDVDPSLDRHGAPYGGQLPSCRGEQNNGTGRGITTGRGVNE